MKTRINDVDRIVGKRINALRRARGLTQTQLAKAAGVRFQQIQKYESGANRVSASRLWAIAHALDTEILYFFQGVVPDDVVRPVSDQHAPIDHLQDAEAVELMTLLRGMPEKHKIALLSVARSMAL